MFSPKHSEGYNRSSGIKSEQRTPALRMQLQGQRFMSPKNELTSPIKVNTSNLNEDRYQDEGIVISSPHRKIKGSNQLPQAFRIIRSKGHKTRK